ncbi:MAG TPA: VOC family protein [Candidatus Agrococcus pullicola]|uniref:VOC family protein n=1 Tax=Candidatus Agrococcus pullicola TaxID=2838429 RepID=A0A9D2C9B1_9MICO|nr:VOC family protein [Candidatus Agrococcus pullicola]
MTARFNHTIIAFHEPEAMAEFYTDLLEVEEVESWGVFTNIRIGDGVLLQFATPPIEFPPQHYAYRLDDDFDRAYAKIIERGPEHWADPRRALPGAINHDHGGRGVYLLDPSGHYLELLTGAYV